MLPSTVGIPGGYKVLCCSSRFNITASMLRGLMEQDEKFFEVPGPYGNGKLIVTGLVWVQMTALG